MRPLVGRLRASGKSQRTSRPEVYFEIKLCTYPRIFIVTTFIILNENHEKTTQFALVLFASISFAQIVNKTTVISETDKVATTKGATDGTKYIIDGNIVYSSQLVRLEVISNCTIGQETTKPFFNAQFGTSRVFTREEIRRMPTTNVSDIVSLTPGVYQKRRGDDVIIFGGRNLGNMMVLDGMQVMQ